MTLFSMTLLIARISSLLPARIKLLIRISIPTPRGEEETYSFPRKGLSAYIHSCFLKKYIEGKHRTKKPVMCVSCTGGKQNVMSTEYI